MDYSYSYVFHFTGKLNQSYVMEKPYGEAVYRADCAGISIFKDTSFTFINCLTGIEKEKKVGKTVTTSFTDDNGLGMNIDSDFKIDKESVWKLIADMGYRFSFSINGLCAHYDVYKNDVYAGYVELGGSGLYIEKYKDSKLGKVPTNGIFKVECTEDDIPGFFHICFAITRTDMAMNNM